MRVRTTRDPRGRVWGGAHALLQALHIASRPSSEYKHMTKLGGFATNGFKERHKLGINERDAGIAVVNNKSGLRSRQSVVKRY